MSVVSELLLQWMFPSLGHISIHVILEKSPATAYQYEQLPTHVGQGTASISSELAGSSCSKNVKHNIRRPSSHHLFILYYTKAHPRWVLYAILWILPHHKTASSWLFYPVKLITPLPSPTGPCSLPTAQAICASSLEAPRCSQEHLFGCRTTPRHALTC